MEMMYSLGYAYSDTRFDYDFEIETTEVTQDDFDVEEALEEIIEPKTNYEIPEFMKKMREVDILFDSEDDLL